MKTIALIILMTMTLSTSVLATGSHKDFCYDTDDGIDVYEAGVVITDKGLYVDDCDGSSENLKEFYCDGDEKKHDNIKCSDYGAVCDSRSGPDKCVCPQGTVFNSQSQMCIDENPNEIPEFNTVAAGIALVGATGGYFLLRRK